MAASSKKRSLNLKLENIERLTRWSSEFAISIHVVMDRSLRSLNVVTTMLESIKQAEAYTKVIHSTHAYYKPGNPSILEGSEFNLNFVNSKKIELSLSSQAAAVLDGLAALLDVSKSEFIDMVLGSFLVESAIRENLSLFN